MDNAEIYRAVILRATLGSGASAAKAADLDRLNRICAHLAECEEVQRTLRRKGYGRSGMSFLEIAQSVPDHVKGMLRSLFKPAGTKDAQDRADLDEAFDAWTLR